MVRREIAQLSGVYVPFSPYCSNFRCPSWWRHQMETFSALLAFCAGNSLVPGEFPAQRPATRSFDVFFDLRLNKRLRKQSWGWWFETLSCPLWRHCNAMWKRKNWIIFMCLLEFECAQRLKAHSQAILVRHVSSTPMRLGRLRAPHIVGQGYTRPPLEQHSKHIAGQGHRSIP